MMKGQIFNLNPHKKIVYYAGALSFHDTFSRREGIRETNGVCLAVPRHRQVSLAPVTSAAFKYNLVRERLGVADVLPR